MLKKETRTFFKRKEDVRRKWLLFDAKDRILGRFASEIAKVLRGKHKPDFTPHVDTGDGVIIINADKIRVTGSKKAQKTYLYYTGHVGGQREIPYEVMLQRKPDMILRRAIQGMMPKSRLGDQQLRKLRIYAGEEHDLQSQQPVRVE